MSTQVVVQPTGSPAPGDPASAGGFLTKLLTPQAMRRLQEMMLPATAISMVLVM